MNESILLFYFYFIVSTSVSLSEAEDFYTTNKVLILEVKIFQAHI